jgi:hypothetical protein
MKRIVSAAMLAAGLLAVAPLVRAQDCYNVSSFHLRGTYVGASSGWMDPSKVLQGMGLPSGLVQSTSVGAFTLDGAGGGGGWISVNTGGSQMNFQIAALKYSINSDCSIQATWSLTIKELGITIGPYSRLGVIVGRPDVLEIHWMFAGTPLGTPAGAGVDLGVAYRISFRN